MANLSKLALTLTQSEEQRTLQVVHVSYGYTLNCSRTAADAAPVYRVSIDVLGDDLLGDDKLALGVDKHEVVCECGESDCEIVVKRDFYVGQKLLDEDIGIDEIKLTINVVSPTGEACSGTTGIVRGNF